MSPYPYLAGLALLAFGRLAFDLARTEHPRFVLADGLVVFDLTMIFFLGTALVFSRISAQPLIDRLKVRGPFFLASATPSLKSILAEVGVLRVGPEPRRARLRVGIAITEDSVEIWTRASEVHKTLPLGSISEVQVRRRGSGSRLFPSIVVRLHDNRCLEFVMLDSVIRILPVGHEESVRIAAIFEERVWAFRARATS